MADCIVQPDVHTDYRMGAYLSTPLIDKISSDETNSYLACGASQMQGWRMSQEVFFFLLLQIVQMVSVVFSFVGKRFLAASSQ